ncbi:uncharacterized protein LOC123560059 [Mercenaria mercenaria]|uniref:uncharacterized protein LOC123560059 n=1 Tax=Mercenaria mercenaria TaxID=6596 RepID=UPI00234E5C39|nr:uncharacterized protein LOC123560059 [Mercenaria mercenaria]
MSVILTALFFVCVVLHVSNAGILMTGQAGGLPVGNDAYNEDDWESVYRIYHGDDWDSHDDYLSQERTARYGDNDDSQFRSWKLDQWHHSKIQKVRLELYDDGDEVAEFEFVGVMQNMTSFFNPRNLRKTTYIDIPVDGSPFTGDDFSFDGDDDARHWTVSYRHRGDCRNDEGWIQVIDKPKPGRDRCVCGYENVDKFPTIMYAKGNTKTKWNNPLTVGYADMMQISVSDVPYPVQMPQNRQPQQTQFQTVFRINPFEMKK